MRSRPEPGAGCGAVRAVTVVCGAGLAVVLTVILTASAVTADGLAADGVTAGGDALHAHAVDTAPVTGTVVDGTTGTWSDGEAAGDAGPVPAQDRPVQDAPVRTGCDEPLTGPPRPLDVDRPGGSADGRGVRVTVIDTGAAAPGVTGDRDDCRLHGTVVAGVVSTVAPGAALTSRRHGPPDAPGSGPVTDLAATISRAVDEGAQIITLSLIACGVPPDPAAGPAAGPAPGTEPALRDALQRAAAADVLVVAAAGNTGQCPGDGAPVPASLPDDDAPGLVTVGAVEPRMRDGRGRDLDAGRNPAPYSLTGAWVDVYAPGGPVSALHDVPGRADPVVIVGDPGPFTGTSFAAPVVTGTAALVRQVLPRATAPQVRRILLGTSSPPPYRVVDPRRAVDEALALRDALWARPPENPVDALTRLMDERDRQRFQAAGSLPDAVTVPVRRERRRDYRIPVVLSALVVVGVCAGTVRRARSVVSSPPSGRTAMTLHGTSVGSPRPSAASSSADPARNLTPASLTTYSPRSVTSAADPRGARR